MTDSHERNPNSAEQNRQRAAEVMDATIAARAALQQEFLSEQSKGATLIESAPQAVTAEPVVRGEQATAVNAARQAVDEARGL